MRRYARPLLAAAALGVAQLARAAVLELPAPPDSVRFGEEFAVLPNGNIVVADRDWSGTAPNAGAVYLFRPDGTQVSRLTGSSANDRIGNWGIEVLPSGNFLVVSQDWDHGSAADAGAVTFGHAETGVSGAVSSANSLVGTSPGDSVGEVVVLRSGHYLVVSSFWDHAGTSGVGAITWGNGTTGVVGPVTAANSLVGSATNDSVGSGGVLALASGHAVAISGGWDHGDALDAGAVTWIRGDRPLAAVVSASNSLVGSSTGDRVGVGRVTELTNGHYVVASHWWTNAGMPRAGAVTWARGDRPTAAAVSVSNSLFGTQSEDWIGSDGVRALPGGAYAVVSPRWNHGAVADVGAVTRLDGDGPYAGPVTPTNSLHGTSPDDRIGEDGFTRLENGNYVVRARSWDDGSVANAGAVTWCSHAAACTGPVTRANSLTGGSPGAAVGDAVFALANGNYLVLTRGFDHGAIADVGAVTFGDGSSGTSGLVSPANSLVGATAGDRIGHRVTPLPNGNYAVGSIDFDHAGLENVGAVTWGNGATGTVGPVSSANSLLGSSAHDEVGDQVDALDDGRYVVSSPRWDRGALADAGAMTWLPGGAPSAGIVTPANSLVGASASDEFGGGAYALPGGGSIVQLSYFDGVHGVDAGAIVLAPPGGLVGEIPANRSLFGTVPDAGQDLYFDWNAAAGHVVVAHAPLNRVALLSPPADALFADGYE